MRSPSVPKGRGYYGEEIQPPSVPRSGRHPPPWPREPRPRRLRAGRPRRERAYGATGTDAPTPAASTAPGEFVPNFMVAPEVPAEVAETLETDVLVIGLGLSGCAAAKAAAEQGAKVIAVEKSPELAAVSMAGDFGVIGSKIQKDLGIEWAGKDVIVNQLMKDMCYRPTPDFLGYWYDHSGEDFDWFVEGADFEVLKSTAANQETDKPYHSPEVLPAAWGYDYKTEHYPYFHGTITTNPNMQWTLEAAVAAAESMGAPR